MGTVIIKGESDVNFFRVVLNNKSLQSWLGEGVVGIGIINAHRDEKGFLWDRVVFPTKKAKEPFWTIMAKINDPIEWMVNCQDIESSLTQLKNESR